MNLLMVFHLKVIVLKNINQKNQENQTLNIVSKKHDNLKNKHKYFNSIKEGVF